MVKLSAKERSHIVQKLDFKKYGIKAWCFHVGKQRVMEEIYEHIRLHPKNKRKDKIYQNFDYHLLNHFRMEIEKMTIAQNMEFPDLRVQCDADMSHTIKFWKMKRETKGKAYELSDAVAWCNEHSRSLKGCHEMDLKDTIYNQMIYDLFR